MNRPLTYVNLCGVLALAVLCLCQWRHDSGLSLSLYNSERTRLGQETKLAEQAGTLRGLDEDIGRFKNSLADEKKERAAAEIKLRAVNATNDLLSLECEQLKISVTNWSNAVTLRDQRILEANDQIKRLSTGLNESVVKFNSLVTNYNALVRDFETLRARSATNTISQ